MKVIRRENETTDELIRRFKREYKKSGVREECKKREYFLKKSLARAEKSKRAKIKSKRKK